MKCKTKINFNKQQCSAWPPHVRYDFLVTLKNWHNYNGNRDSNNNIELLTSTGCIPACWYQQI